jgi:hypothetical protein
MRARSFFVQQVLPRFAFAFAFAFAFVREVLSSHSAGTVLPHHIGSHDYGTKP